MARVLIADPYPAIAELFAHVVRELGHEVVLHTSRADAGALDVDLVVVEPDSPVAVDCAWAVRALRPDVPVVCASICMPGDRSERLEPAAYLLKPFPLSELAEAVEAALAPS